MCVGGPADADLERGGERVHLQGRVAGHQAEQVGVHPLYVHAARLARQGVTSARVRGGGAREAGGGPAARAAAGGGRLDGREHRQLVLLVLLELLVVLVVLLLVVLRGAGPGGRRGRRRRGPLLLLGRCAGLRLWRRAPGLCREGGGRGGLGARWWW